MVVSKLILSAKDVMREMDDAVERERPEGGTTRVSGSCLDAFINCGRLQSKKSLTLLTTISARCLMGLFHTDLYAQGELIQQLEFNDKNAQCMAVSTKRRLNLHLSEMDTQ